MVSQRNNTLILASSSPRRQELIRTFGLPVDIRASHADETVDAALSPPQIVETLALRKAEAVYETYNARSDGGRDIIVGSDTIVVLKGEVMGKPQDDRDALRMLEKLQGDTHQVYTGVALIDANTGRRLVNHRVTDVTMKPLDRQRLLRYIATGEPRDKAGSYAIQGFGATLVEAIRGDYFNVVGLPLALLGDMLGELGIAYM